MKEVPEFNCVEKIDNDVGDKPGKDANRHQPGRQLVRRQNQGRNIEFFL